ncbi:MAG: SGNH/GDSL hydrolase family protein [Bacteroidia bacterium]
MIVYLLIVFCFQEAVFRFLFPLPEIENLDRRHYTKIGEDEQKRVHARDQDWYWESSLDTSAIFLHEMNRYGFRDRGWKVEKPVGKKRVLFIGDSFVEGVMASQQETIPQAFLNAGGEAKYEAFNAGMLGTGLSAYLQLLADLTPIYKPDAVVVCVYANDLGKQEPLVPPYFLEAQFFNPYRPRLLEIFRQMKSRGPIRFRWASSPKAFLPAVPEAGNPWTSAEAELSDQVAPALAKAMKEGHFNPFRVNALALEEQQLKAPPKLGETVPFFKYICEQHDAQPLLVYIPSRNQLTDYYLQFERQSCLTRCSDSMSLSTETYRLPQRELARQCQQFQIPFLDLTASLEQHEKQGQHLYWDYDEHMRGKGYRFLGKTIWEALREIDHKTAPE